MEWLPDSSLSYPKDTCLLLSNGRLPQHGAGGWGGVGWIGTTKNLLCKLTLFFFTNKSKNQEMWFLFVFSQWCVLKKKVNAFFSDWKIAHLQQKAEGEQNTFDRRQVHELRHICRCECVSHWKNKTVSPTGTGAEPPLTHDVIGRNKVAA